MTARPPEKSWAARATVGQNRVVDPWWPLFDLTLRTPRLLLRPVRDDDFAGLLEAIDSGIHDPQTMPFSIPWTDAQPPVRRRNTVQYWWRNRANWKATDWNLDLVVVFDDHPIGSQALFAKDFPVLKEVGTGSWLASAYQGRGLGKEMRAAVLQLAFEGLEAVVARSGAFADNQSSAGLSRALGYRVNGQFRQAPRGKPKEMVNFELTSAEWSSRRAGLPLAEIAGLGDALGMFGSTQEHPQT